MKLVSAVRFVLLVSLFGSAVPRAQSSIACVQRFPVSGPFAGAGMTEGDLAFEASTGHCFWFGGRDGLGRPNSKVFEWTGSTWIVREPKTGPGALRHFAWTSLAPKPGVLLHGGIDGHDVTRNETWLWTGSEWRLLTASGPIHLARHALAYDRARDRVVLFGGDVNGKRDFPIYELWEFDGTIWLRRLSPNAPQRRYGHTLVYDPLRQRTVLFGGATNGGVVLADQWEWDGFRWAAIVPAVAPPPRVHARATFDAVRGTFLLAGGTSSVGGAALADLWEWDPFTNAWSQRIPYGPVPAARANHGFAFDPVRGRLLLVGGDDPSGSGPSVRTDTWDVFAVTPTAQATAYGRGCPGSTGIPTLRASGPPRLGDPGFGVVVQGARANAPLAAIFTLNAESRALGSGCVQLVAEPWFGIAAATTSSGAAFVPLPVPPAFELLGLELYVQGFVADPLGAIAGVAAATGGLDLLIGT